MCPSSLDSSCHASKKDGKLVLPMGPREAEGSAFKSTDGAVVCSEQRSNVFIGASSPSFDFCISTNKGLK